MSPSDFTPKQLEGITRLYEHDETLAMVPMGWGKTVVAQTAAQDMLEEGELDYVLVIAPKRVCEEVWAHECDNWVHLHQPVILAGCDKASREQEMQKVWQGAGHMIVISFELVKWFLTEHGKLIEKFRVGLIVDELSKLKGGGAQFKAIRRWIPKFHWRVGLTGTPAEEGLDMLFYQVMLLDGGHRFGKNRERWLRRHFWPEDFNEYRWEPQPGAEEKLILKISDLTFIAGYEDPGAIPDVKETRSYVYLPETARELYKTMAQDMLLTFPEGDDVTAVNAAVKSGKLEQLANGFAYRDDGEVVTVHDHKMIVARHWVQDEPGQVMIVYRFVWQLEQLRQVFPDGLEMRDPGALEQWESGALGKLFIHPTSGGHGLNLQKSGCSRIVFLGPIWSRDQTDQVIARIVRRGNPAKLVHVLTIVGDNTVEDQVMLPRLEGKADTAARFRAHLEEIAG